MNQNQPQLKQTKLGLIPGDWDYVKLQDKVEIIMGQSPSSKFYNNQKEGLPFMQGIRTFGPKYPTIDTWTTSCTKLAKKDSVLFSVRAPVGEINISPSDLCIGRGLASLNYEDNQFLYYLLQAYKPDIVNQETGTVYGSISTSDIKKIYLPFPKLSEQHQIASILSSLDDKIELNRKMNKTLESIAKAIFKRWFVDFEFPFDFAQGKPSLSGQPYKSSGGKMIDSELGLIPERWRVGNLSDLCEITTGKRPETRSDIKDDKFQIPLIGASSVQGYVKEALYTENIIVTGRVGTHGILQRVSEPCWPSDNTLVIRSDQLSFIYQMLANINLSKLNRGSTQPLITQGDLKKTKIIIPDQSTLLQYDNISEFDTMINITLNQNNNLSHLRDLLLPRLMSGRIRVE